jgi:preprotein translocase subunit SecF
MALSLIFVATKGLNLGIDFAGGILIEVKIEKESQKESPIVEIKELRSLVSQHAKDVQVQNIDEKNSSD